MAGWSGDIVKLTAENEAFRAVVYTGEYSQLAVMCINPGVETGEKSHAHLDQYVQIQSGSARLTLGRHEKKIDEVLDVEENWGAWIPAGMWHNITNSGHADLKLYTIYSPPSYPAETYHETAADAAESARLIQRGIAEGEGFGA